jgi:hypothetical protein
MQSSSLPGNVPALSPSQILKATEGKSDRLSNVQPAEALLEGLNTQQATAHQQCQ